MSKSAMLVGALALGTAGGFAGGMLAGEGAEAPRPDPRPVSSPSGSGAAALERLERRVDELAASVRPGVSGEVPPPVAPVPAEGPAPKDAPPTPAPVPDRLADLERRIAVLERSGGRGTPIPEDLSKVPPAQLEALVRTLYGEKRYADGQRVAEEMLRRGDLTPEQRTEAEMQIGYAMRGLGKHAEAEARFRESLARVGDTGEQAPWLGFQIAWERSYQKDYAGASQEMERSANHPSVSAVVRVHSLLGAANFAVQAGDKGRARVFAERLLNQHAADIPATQPFIKQQAEAILKD